MMSRNSWDSSMNDEYDHRRLTETTTTTPRRPRPRRPRRPRRVSSLDELSAHTLSTAFTLNDLESIETVSSLDVDDDRDNNNNNNDDGFGFIDDDDDDDEDVVESPKMVELMTHNTTTAIIKTSEVLCNDVDDEMMNKVDDSSLDTVERERRRIDKHTEAHELREVFCHPPTTSHNKEQTGGTSHHQRQKYSPSHAQEAGRNRIIMHPMHESMNVVGSNSEILMDRGRIFQRRHSF